MRLLAVTTDSLTPSKLKQLRQWTVVQTEAGRVSCSKRANDCAAIDRCASRRRGGARSVVGKSPPFYGAALTQSHCHSAEGQTLRGA